MISRRWVAVLQVCTAMGCSAGFSSAPLTGSQLRKVAIHHSLSLAWHLGRAVLSARAAKEDPVQAVAAEGGGNVLFEGATQYNTARN